MDFWRYFQMIFDFVSLAAFVLMWTRLNRPVKDDPRMSRGLQVLQTKISILEDLSDRTEIQVSQLTTLLEKKCKDLRELVQEADKEILKIERSREQSLEVAKIFQDKIPHSEILERQNTAKYVKAARLANQGKSLDEIAREVGLRRGELEFIAKINKDHLVFSEDNLPAWMNEDPKNAESFTEVINKLEAPKIAKPQSIPGPTNPQIPTSPSLPEAQPHSFRGTRVAQKAVVKPFEFPRIG